LTGVGTNPTLNVTLGSYNDSAESVITPILKGIQTVNVQVVGNSGGINFQDTDGLTTLNVNRFTNINGEARFEDLDSTVTTLSVNNAARASEIHFHYREDVLTATDDELTLNLNNARAEWIHLEEDSDDLETGEDVSDAGYFFETINLNATGTNDIDDLDILANGREDIDAGLAEDTTNQTLYVLAGAAAGAAGSLEINNLDADGVETMTLVANQRVDIASDKMVALAAGNNGISTQDLETLTITGAGNVMIDGLDTDRLATITLTVNASAMTGNLKLGVDTASDGSSSGTYATRADIDLSVTSGSGDDQIVTYSTLAGNITTNDGKDTVRVGNATTSAASLDVEGVSTITTGEGNDTVVAKDLLVTAADRDEDSNTNFDDVTAATINTGAGNDSVTVGALTSGSDWDNITITDSNNNDQQFIVGASVITGAGTDSVSFTTIAEGASISTGDDADTITVSLTAANGTILAGDTDADVVSVVTATNGDAGSTYTDEVSALGIADLLGAEVDTGSGDDTVTFTDASSLEVDANTLFDVVASNTIVARDALLAGGAGEDTLSITTLDVVTVTTLTSMTDQDNTTTGTQTDINANVTGVETLNLTVANQIVNSGITNTAASVVTTAAADSSSVGSIAVTFNARYDLGDVVTVTMGATPTEFSHTVVNGATTGADVAAAFQTLFDAAGIGAGPAAFDADADYASTTLTGATLTIATDADTVDGDNAIAVSAGVTNAIRPYLSGNDNRDADGAFTVDVLRFDADLTVINMTSQEQILETGPATEYYLPGTATSFTLNNLREEVALTLTAHEATGVNAGALADDTLLSINSTTGAVTTNANAKDIDLTMNWDASSETDDAAEINIGAPAGALSGNFDVLFALGAAATNTTVGGDDSADRLENFTINVTDGNSHSFDFFSAGFGDANWGINGTDGTNAAVTSLTVNTGGAAVQVDNVGTDTITFNNAAGTAVTAANVTLRVNQANNFTITTGSGTDIIDMRADTVRADDNVTSADRADHINAGSGRDTLIVLGGNDMSSHDLDLNNALTDVSTELNDDVFETIQSVETLIVDSDSATTTTDIVLDEAAAEVSGLDTIKLVDSDGAAGGDDHALRLVIGNNFAVSSSAVNGELTTATSALVIDASQHASETILEIENKDDDTDLATVNLDIRVTSEGGADILLGDLGGSTSRTEIRVTAQEEVATIIDATATVATDGVVDIFVDANESFQKLVMVDSADTNAGESALTVTAASAWTGTAFELDASALLDTDGDADTGGLTFSVETADTAAYTVSGTQNSDDIEGSNQGDTIYGNGGNDDITGDVVSNVNDVLTLSNATYRTGDAFSVVLGGITFVVEVGETDATYDLDDGKGAVDVAIAGSIGTSSTDILSALQTAVIAATAAQTGAENWTTEVDAAAKTLTLVQTTAQQAASDADITASTFTAADATQQSTTVTFTNVAAGTLTATVTVTYADGTSATYSATDDDKFDEAMASIETAMDLAGFATTYTAATDTFVVAGGAAMTQGFSVTASTSDASYSTSTSTTATYVAATTQDDDTIDEDIDVIIGGADTIDGGAGDDIIEGSYGADTLIGGAGTDTLSYAGSNAAVSVNLATAAVSGGHAAGDVISLFENILGSDFDDTLVGDSSANTLTGGEGDDTLTGGAGADIFVIDGSDTITDFATGIDTLELSEYLTGAETYAEIADDGADIASAANVIVVGGATNIAAAAAHIAGDATVTATGGFIVISDATNTYVYHSDDLADNGTETLVATLTGITNATSLVAADFTFATVT
jgi:hypothetical protein